MGLGASRKDLMIINCTFRNNNATNGGAIFIFQFSYSLIIIYSSTFTNNTAVTGAAVHAKDAIDSQGKPLGGLRLQDVVITDNQCFGGVAIYFDGLIVEIVGNSPTGSQFSSNSPKGAIQGQNGLLQLHGITSHSQRTEE